ncbi:preprotein translocase subunit SecG [Alginatibacterium sediminis]|uniref:Protein-export membrane protein SecG n=1 Tax=Alginatibacterium sediminis TaxID=2164068 RepID=A0A420E854_9ALTE|nr:preprotein translocase subunit SecG [Alginatibacterium sediminis]RKF15585.1 preprotein translocase subunit SecG [Alginatibacterium sediminis]
MYTVLIVAYLLIALTLIGLVLLQQGKGADMGASFGSGASNTVFGSSGSGNFLTRMTAVMAAGFFILSLVLGNLTTRQTKQVDEWSDLSLPAVEQVSEAPTAPAIGESVPE